MAAALAGAGPPASSRRSLSVLGARSETQRRRSPTITAKSHKPRRPMAASAATKCAGRRVVRDSENRDSENTDGRRPGSSLNSTPGTAREPSEIPNSRTSTGIDMDVLSSRILLRPADPDRSRRFYRDVLGLAVYREFGSPADPGVVFFLGPGLLEVSGRAAGPAGDSVMIWLQVRDVHAEHERLAAAGVRVLREPTTEPWGLIEMWIEDPDGVRIVLVEIPADHPLRRDPRSSPAPIR